MSKSRKWHVEFDVTTGFDLGRARMADHPRFALDGQYVYPIAEGVKITEIIPPLEPGYYVRKDGHMAYMRDHAGRWYRRSKGSWAEAASGEEEMRTFGSRIAPLGLEDSD